MDISDAPQYENALHQHEILLRHYKLTRETQFAELPDAFDSIDLSGALLTELSSRFPLLPRLKTLLLSGNRIRRINAEFARQVPNLESLNLSHNFISGIENLQFLGSLPHLTHLCLEGNPAANSSDLRRQVIAIQPNLMFLDFERVSENERQSAKGLSSESRANALRRAELIKRLDAASSLEEIDAIEQELITIGSK